VRQPRQQHRVKADVLPGRRELLGGSLQDGATGGGQLACAEILREQVSQHPAARSGLHGAGGGRRAAALLLQQQGGGVRAQQGGRVHERKHGSGDCLQQRRIGATLAGAGPAAGAESFVPQRIALWWQQQHVRGRHSFQGQQRRRGW
jgi:hypothetical protein